MPHPPPSPDPFAKVNPQKSRSGLNRLWHALGYSVAGLRAAWCEKAFRQEVIAAVVMLPAAAWLARDWREWALLAVPVVLVLVVELLNSAVEAAIDRFGPQWHQLSKNAKDMGSAAVLLSIGLCIAIWGAALYERFA